MKESKIKLLKEILDTGIYDVNTETGQIYNNNTKRFIGNSVNKTGFKTVTFTYLDPETGKAKNYIYYTHLVIAYVGGLNIHRHIKFRNDDKTDIRIENLRLENKLRNFK